MNMREHLKLRLLHCMEHRAEQRYQQMRRAGTPGMPSALLEALKGIPGLAGSPNIKMVTPEQLQELLRTGRLPDDDAPPSSSLN